MLVRQPLDLASSVSPKYGDGVKRRDQIKMTEAEVEQFLVEEHTMTMCSFNHDGTIHAVAMWYGFLEACLVVSTKGKSQKALNLRRDPRVTCLIEQGERYDQLRGVELVGLVEVVDDPTRLFEIGINLFERYSGPFDENVHRHEVEKLVHKRVGFKIVPARVVSWDHRKLPSIDN